MPYANLIKRREKNKEYGRKYRSKPGIREKRIQYFKEWREKNINHVREYLVDWHKRNPDYYKGLYPKHRERMAGNRRKYQNNLHDKTLQVASNHCRNWDSSEEYFLVSNRSIMSVPDLAYELGRTNYAIVHKLYRLDEVEGDIEF